MPIVVLAIALCAGHSAYFTSKTDDAYITFSYAQNWVHGQGVVFNAGERVEGYTCFLWVALSAVGLFLGAEIGAWSTALGIVSVIGALLAAWRLAYELAPRSGRDGAVLVMVLLAAYPPLAWWAASGMETGLFTGLVTASIWLHVRRGARSIAAPICLALASMTRPEAWLLSGLLCVDALRLAGVRAAARYIGVFLAIFGPYYGWRFWYYGYPLPNTFYAKVGRSPEQVLRGRWYLLEFLISGRGAILLLGALAGTGIVRRLAMVYVFIVAYVTYVVLVGGDFFGSYRLLIPIVPTLAALSVAALLRCADRLFPGQALVAQATCAVAVSAFVLSCVPSFRAQQQAWKPIMDFWQSGYRSCTYLKARTTPADSIAAIGIGVVKFCTGLRVIDMAGLTDAHIAHLPIDTIGQGLPGHEKYDSAYVLAQRPKFIVIPHPDTFRGLLIPALSDMWQQPLLRQYYVPDAYGYRRIDP